VGERKDLVLDGAQNLVDTYIHKQCDYPTWSELLPKVWTKKGPTNKKTEVERGEHIMIHDSKCRHAGYQMEPNQGYCKEGFYLLALKCGSCSKVFVLLTKNQKWHMARRKFQAKDGCTHLLLYRY
jgi:hypothetical protein